jgi:4'-phosphopantetheinyl transferase
MDLGPNEVHVWHARFDALPKPAAPVPDPAILSREERARAERITVPKAHASFLASRTLLRRVLAKYAGEEGAALRIRVEGSGKPRLEHPSWLRFNLAHSPAMWVFAVSRDRDVGIDVEELDRRVNVAAVARRLFHPDELAALDRLPEEQRRRAFFRVWAQREAVVKTLGEGMLEHGREFSVEADPTRTVAVRGRDLTLAELDLGPGAVCAVAREGRDRSFEVALRDW